MSEITTAQITVTATPTLIVRADTDGCVVLLHTHANHGIEIGNATVALGAGFGLHENQTVEIRLPANEAIYGIRTGAQNETVYVMRVGNR
jgi:hypothetical protein